MPANRTTLIRAGVILGSLAVLSAGAVAGKALLGGRQEKPQNSQQGAIRGFATLTHPSAGFRIAYPRQWQQFDSKDPPQEVPLVAGPGGDDFVLVRMCRLPEDIPPEAVPALREGFDAIIKKGGTNILEQRQIRLNGLPGFYYLYAFADEASQKPGVHSHYFLVDKSVVFQLVFQALPADDFKGLAGTFDRIANSFRAMPRSGPVAPCTAAESPPSPGAPPPEGQAPQPPVPPPAP